MPWESDFPGGSVLKNLQHCQWRRLRRWGSIPGSGRPPGEGNGNPLQCSCLENPRDGAWWAAVSVVAQSRTRLKWLSSSQAPGGRDLSFLGVKVEKKLPAGAGDARVWVRSLGREDPLEEEMATHSSILAGKIPWTERLGRLQSMTSQSWTRVSMHREWPTASGFNDVS